LLRKPQPPLRKIGQRLLSRCDFDGINQPLDPVEHAAGLNCYLLFVKRADSAAKRNFAIVNRNRETPEARPVRLSQLMDDAVGQVIVRSFQPASRSDHARASCLRSAEE
jgi:hypothetical protein